MKRWQQILLGGVLLLGGVVLLSIVWHATVSGQTGTGTSGTANETVGAGTTAATSSTDPDAVHHQWVTALQHDDQAAALALSAPQDQQAGVVDAALQMMRRSVPANAETGGVTTVDVQPVTANGEERVGTSVWTFVKSKACFQATLNAQSDGSWRVRQWERIPCR